jgi:hypothetical protein
MLAATSSSWGSWRADVDSRLTLDADQHGTFGESSDEAADVLAASCNLCPGLQSLGLVLCKVGSALVLTQSACHMLRGAAQKHRAKDS